MWLSRGSGGLGKRAGLGGEGGRSKATATTHTYYPVSKYKKHFDSTVIDKRPFYLFRSRGVTYFTLNLANRSQVLIDSKTSVFGYFHRVGFSYVRAAAAAGAAEGGEKREERRRQRLARDIAAPSIDINLFFYI